MSSLGETRDEFRSIRLLVSGTLCELEDVRATVEAESLEGRVYITHRFDNVGFSSGHNMLLREAFNDGADYVLVLNPDLYVEAGALVRLVGYASTDGRFALYGPSLMRVETEEGKSQVVDSMGIGWSISGRHYDLRQGEPWLIQEGKITRVDGLTGACLLVSRVAFERIVNISGWFFDDLFLAYREDAELGIRATEIGVESRLVETGGFGHVRAVRGYRRGNQLPDLLGVRNRFLLRWRLGRSRPGVALVSTARDLVVLLAALVAERSSWPGVRSAFAIRRHVLYSRLHNSELSTDGGSGLSAEKAGG
jgi:GT2 family glycosyltransferase